MKRFLFALLAVMMILPAMAEGPKRLININPASFQPVQKGALSGVNIDPIAKDRSQRACARIKLHINRMTREDIDQIVVYPIGGNIELTKKVASYEGNGLILEMTAKPQTRFYIHHDKYGDSNEVMLNLEGNKEYYLEGHLDLLLLIAVATNVVGADVYLDNIHKGVINDTCMCSIPDVTPGVHNLKVMYGATITEQQINVSNESFAFRIEVKISEGKDSKETITRSITSPPYNVGDYYNDGKKEGVVFWVDASRLNGKIVSLKESSNELEWSSRWEEQGVLVGAKDRNNGVNNMAKIFKRKEWQDLYPPFKWCADLGEGWYLPAIEELKMFAYDHIIRNIINKTLSVYGQEITKWYWSSTEANKSFSDLLIANRGSAWIVNAKGNKFYDIYKSHKYYVRAVSSFTSSVFTENSNKKRLVINYTTTNGEMLKPASSYKIESIPLEQDIESHTYGKITLKPGVDSLRALAFYGCKKLLSISIPKEIKSVGEYAFLACDKLKRVDIEDLSAWCKIDFYGDWLTADNPLSNHIKGGVDLYLNGDKIIDIVVPSDIKCIKPRIFDFSDHNKSVKSITIHENVSSIGEEAISYAIKTIYCKAPYPPTIKIYDTVSYDGITVYVPNEFVSRYKCAQGWKKFNIVGYDFND